MDEHGRFRTGWVLVPLALLLMAYILHHIQPVYSWADICEFLHVKDREAYTRLFALGLLITAVVAWKRIWGNGNKDD